MNEIVVTPLNGEPDDLIAAYTCLDQAEASLGKHLVIRIVDRAVPRLRYYAPRQLRDDAKPIQLGMVIDRNLSPQLARPQTQPRIQHLPRLGQRSRPT